MIIGIDASNISTGGGVTHLVEILRKARPLEQGIDQVYIWAQSDTLHQLEDRSWLNKEQDELLNRGLAQRLYWQRFQLPLQLQERKCDLLFVPGGVYLGTFDPFVTMSRTMLPFEWGEIKRYGISWLLFRLLTQRYLQIATFRKADGLIFLSEYAQEVVGKSVKKNPKCTTMISHGISDRFYCQPRIQERIDAYDQTRRFQILYVSHIEPYKHQWHVIEAVAKLVQKGFPVWLNLVGRLGNAVKRYHRAISEFDPNHKFVRYHGPQPYTELHSIYHQVDLFVYASSCENLPNTLLEAMASGLPIASSNRGPMPEVLGEAGLYFDPENPDDIADSLLQFLERPNLRKQKAWTAYVHAQSYSWERCARETFSFFAEVALL
jgi:glycosyltransferase involved in cell wall biosynthesis